MTEVKISQVENQNRISGGMSNDYGLFVLQKKNSRKKFREDPRLRYEKIRELNP